MAHHHKGHGRIVAIIHTEAVSAIVVAVLHGSTVEAETTDDRLARIARAVLADLPPSLPGAPAVALPRPSAVPDAVAEERAAVEAVARYERSERPTLRPLRRVEDVIDAEPCCVACGAPCVGETCDGCEYDDSPATAGELAWVERIGEVA